MNAFANLLRQRHRSDIPARARPGSARAGVEVSPIKGTPANAGSTWCCSLEDGYEMQETLEADFSAVHLAVASGDASYTFNHWRPPHNDFDRAGEAVRPVNGDHRRRSGLLHRPHDRRGIWNHVDPATGRSRDRRPASVTATGWPTSRAEPGWPRDIRGSLDALACVARSSTIRLSPSWPTRSRFNEGAPIPHGTRTPNWISDALVPMMLLHWGAG